MLGTTTNTAGGVTSAAWLPPDTSPVLATGHTSGCVLLWRTTPPTAQPTPLTRLTCGAGSGPAAPVATLRCVAAEHLGGVRLLAFGGQPPDEPQLLSLFDVGLLLVRCTVLLLLAVVHCQITHTHTLINTKHMAFHRRQLSSPPKGGSPPRPPPSRCTGSAPSTVWTWLAAGGTPSGPGAPWGCSSSQRAVS